MRCLPPPNGGNTADVPGTVRRHPIETVRLTR